MESADPAGSAARAEALLAPVLSRRRGPGEADLAAIAAPDDTSVFFCRTDAGRDGWLGDFVELEPDARRHAGLRAIDHVVLSQPFDYFDEAALFYRSVLGLQPRDSQDLAAPDGLLRSRSASDPAAACASRSRCRGSAAESTAGWQSSSTSPSPATTCSPPPAGCATRRAAAGDPRQLLRRSRRTLGADDDVIEALRALGRALRRRARGGELLHFFTEMVGGRLFFEVVERRGSYDGYGAANSPVRMAAQSAQTPREGGDSPMSIEAPLRKGL